MDARARLAPIEPALAEAASFTEATLDALLPKSAGPEAVLLDAMRHAVLGESRRLRAFLLLQSGRLFGVDRRALGRVAAAVECLHAYSLARDIVAEKDPVVGKDRGNAAAVLFAGDALLTLAFGLIASPETHGDPYVRCELMAKFSAASGYSGMIGGRMLEIAFGDAIQPLPEITRLARMKTASLVIFCCEAGAIMGKASAASRQALSAYGQELGLAWQIANDLKATGPSSLVSLLGADRAQAQAEALVEQAATHLDPFDEKADLLRAAAYFVLAHGA